MRSRCDFLCKSASVTTVRKSLMNKYPSKEGIHGSISGAIQAYVVLFDLCNNCAKRFLTAIKKFVKVKLKYDFKMETVTIPKKLIKNDDLVVIPRREYEKLFRFWNSADRMTVREKKAVEKGFREIKQGKFITSKLLRHELGL